MEDIPNDISKPNAGDNQLTLFDYLDRKFARMDRNFAQVDRRLGKAEDSYRELRNEVRALSTKIDIVEKEVLRMSGDLEICMRHFEDSCDAAILPSSASPARKRQYAHTYNT